MRHLLFRTLCAGLLALAVAACDSPQERAERHLERARELVAAKETKKAALEYRNAIRLNQGLSEARFEYARLLFEQGRIPAALDELLVVRRQDPRHLEARLLTAQIFLLAGALDKAADTAAEAVALAPGSAEALSVSAMADFRRGKVEEAVRDANAALQADPKHVPAILLLVTASLQAQDGDGARTLVEEALAEQPENLALNLARLEVLRLSGDQDAWENQLVRLIELSPDRADFKIALASRQFSDGRPVEAEAMLRAAVGGDAPDTSLATALVEVVRRERGDAAALAEIARLHEAAPQSVDISIALAQEEARHERRDDALARLSGLAGDEALTIAERNRARAALATLQALGGDLEAAEATAAAALAEDPTDADALMLRGGARLELGRTELAQADLEAARERRPGHAETLLMLATANARLGRDAIAEDNLSEAVRVSGYAAGPLQRYIDLLLRTGRPDAAEDVLAKAAAARGASADLIAARGRVRLAQGDWAGAEAAAEALRSADPSDAGTLTSERLLASALGGQGRGEEGAALLATRLEDGGGDAATLGMLIDHYLATEEVERAAAFLDRLLLANPDDVPALILSAKTSFAAGDAESGIDRLRKAVAAEPANGAAQLALASALGRLSRRDEAIDAARAALTSGGADTPELRLLLASMLTEAERRDEAIAEYEELLRRFPGSPLVANNLANLLLDDDASPEALETARKLARPLRDHQLAAFRETYGWMLFRQGEYQEALKVLKEVIPELAEVAEAQLHLGRAYIANGEDERGRAALETALRLAREHGEDRIAASAEAALNSAID